MHLDSCGCLWGWDGDALDILPCNGHQDEVERARRIAWKLVARRGMTFHEAWQYLAMRFVGRLLATF